MISLVVLQGLSHQCVSKVTLADVMLAIGRESQFNAILGQCPKFAVNRDRLDTVKIAQRDAPLRLDDTSEGLHRATPVFWQ